MSHFPDDPTPQAYVPERPSKTLRKHKAHDLQSLGQDLVELPASRLVGLAMPEVLRDAIAEYKRTRSFEGKRRQLQYIGKQMRHADEAPLREAVSAYKLGSAKDTLKLHQTECWRDELVADDAAATRWAAEFAGSDLQRLRSLIRAARKDAAAAPEQRNGRGYRELFQFIKPWLGVGAAAGADVEQDYETDDDSAQDSGRDDD
ncbi:MAG: DUF615 domain-containing protein [Microbacteriaceae bacterium]|nr:DUF615 domain-containing protein [Burkholderiaceae bacterium]